MFNDQEKATLLFAERITRGASAIREGTIEGLRQHYSEAEIVELTLAVCLANLTNRFNDTLQSEPDLGD